MEMFVMRFSGIVNKTKCMTVRRKMMYTLVTVMYTLVTKV